MSIQANLQNIIAGIPKNVKLVAVSKYHPNEAVMEAYNAGQRIFGESKVQEMTQKHDTLPDDIQWHFIGHLQSNKIKYMISYVSMIHAIDTFALLKEIDKHAKKADRTVNCLLQIHLAQEETKFGFSFDECRNMLKEGEWKNLKNIRICGVMGMATNTDDTAQIRKEFASLHNFFNEIKNEHFACDDFFKEISMGMSHDYQIAIEEGSTMVRVGTSIFGERVY